MKCIRHKRYDFALLEGIEYPDSHFSNHSEVFRKLIGKRPYTITVLIENLNPKLWRRKDYCRQTRIRTSSRYLGLLYKAFYTDFGKESAETNYRKWLNKYRSLWLHERKTDNLDDYIIWNELEPRYKEKTLKRFSNPKELFKPRYRIEPERFYHLPPPLNQVDWRNPYDNIFVWWEGDKKFAVRGGSGSSGQRQINSMYIYGYALINKHTPVPSALFIYDKRNFLWFVRRFSSLTIPEFDIGSNYHISREEGQCILKDTRIFRWKISQEPIERINIVKKSFSRVDKELAVLT